MKEIALHLLDLAENSVSAYAKTVSIAISEDLAADQLTASVEDDGRGMTAEMVKMVVDPFVTSRTTRKVGLGIPLLKAAAESCNGGLEILSTPGKGTKVTVTFQHSHIDRMPLGNVSSTFLALLVAHPDVHWLFSYSKKLSLDSDVIAFEFDDKPVKDTIEDLPLTHPDILAYLRAVIEDGVAEVQNTN